MSFNEDVYPNEPIFVFLHLIDSRGYKVTQTNLGGKE